jgi:AcrR family transcriptional regulator
MHAGPRRSRATCERAVNLAHVPYCSFVGVPDGARTGAAQPTEVDAREVSANGGRRLLRRQQTIEDALDAAVAIMEEAGVGGLSMSEIARRLGMRQPSLYKYFPSLHAVYDALFARGIERSGAAVQSAVAAEPRGLASIRAASRALVRWAVENPALAQLLYWRPVPVSLPRRRRSPPACGSWISCRPRWQRP